MPVVLRPVCSMAVATLLLCSTSGLGAQEIRKMLREYSHTSSIRYAPSDPWTNSRLYRYHAGFAGRYFNCDGEEEKRFSPYICWKTKPTTDHWITRCKSLISWDLYKVRQRVKDGNCGCGKATAAVAVSHARPFTPGCQCTDCNTLPGAVLESPPEIEHEVQSEYDGKLPVQKPQRTILDYGSTNSTTANQEKARQDQTKEGRHAIRDGLAEGLLTSKSADRYLVLAPNQDTEPHVVHEQRTKRKESRVAELRRNAEFELNKITPQTIKRR